MASEDVAECILVGIRFKRIYAAINTHRFLLYVDAYYGAIILGTFDGATHTIRHAEALPVSEDCLRRSLQHLYSHDESAEKDTPSGP